MADEPTMAWLKALSRYTKPPAPNQPLIITSTPFLGLATDTFCIVRAPLQGNYTVRYPKDKKEPEHANHLYAAFDRIIERKGSLIKRGTLDALLLKEMAGESYWEENAAELIHDASAWTIELDGAVFHTLVLARALHGWTEPEATFYRVQPEGLKEVYHQLIVEDGFSLEEISPLVLTAGQMVVAVGARTPGDERQLKAAFPESAIVYKK